MIKRVFFLTGWAVMLCFFSGCKSNITNLDSVFLNNTAKYSTKNTTSADSAVLFINGSRLIVKEVLSCNKYRSVGAKQEEEDFLNSNIQYFKSDTIHAGQLQSELYFRSFLRGTHFLEFEESNFYKENFIFSIEKARVKNYGVCYIGKYYFPSAVNSAQRRASVIINLVRKEISIWNFDNVNITEDGLIGDFNVRGKHTFYPMQFSLRCDRFVYVVRKSKI